MGNSVNNTNGVRASSPCSRFLTVLLSRLGFAKQHRVDVGQDPTLGDGHTGQELAQLFVIADGQLNVARGDASLFIVACSVPSQLQNFSREVLENSG